jgi:predicted transcriptional regulator YdeE
MTITSGSYVKFTTNTGEMPQVLIDAWKEVWQMDDGDFGGKRKYKTDFEIYGQNSAEVYIGVDVS